MDISVKALSEGAGINLPHAFYYTPEIKYSGRIDEIQRTMTP